MLQNGNRIGDEGAIAIAQALQENKVGCLNLVRFFSVLFLPYFFASVVLECCVNDNACVGRTKTILATRAQKRLRKLSKRTDAFKGCIL